MGKEEPKEIPYGSLTYKWAVLADRFHLLPAALADMTDRQIDGLLFYPRDKDGLLLPPKGPAEAAPPAPTRESRLKSIDQIEAVGLITAKRAQELRDEVNSGKKEG
jgi:hypothetical protein